MNRRAGKSRGEHGAFMIFVQSPNDDLNERLFLVHGSCAGEHGRRVDDHWLDMRRGSLGMGA